MDKNIIQIIDDEISSINKSSKSISVHLSKTGDGIYKGTLPFKVEGDYILNSRSIVNQPVYVEYLDNQVLIEIDSNEERINAFLTKDEASLLKAIKENIRIETFNTKPSFIVGPPGTGKTKVIAKVLEEALKLNKKVLVASPTNMAVENVFEYLSAQKQDLKDGDVVLTIKTDIETLREFNPEAIKKRKIQPIMDEMEILNMAKDEMVKIKREAQPTLDSCKNLKETTATKLANLNKDLQKVLHKQKEYKNSISGIENRVKLLSGNTLLKSVANMFMSKKLGELEDEKRGFERKLEALKDETVTIQNKITEAESSNEDANEKLVKASGEIYEANTSLEKITDQLSILRKKADAIKSNDIYAEAKIIGATLVNASLNKKIQEGDFDMVIVDEASMALVPYLLVASQSLNSKILNMEKYSIDTTLNSAQNRAVEMALNSKLIFVGDPAQLPPIARTYELKKSIFSVYGVEGIFNGKDVENTVLLDTNYRNHPDITKVASNLFYNGLLKSGKVDDGKSSLYIRRSTSRMVSSEGSFVNQGNMNIVLEQVSKALKRGRRSIGIITPYRKQASNINEKLSFLKGEFPDADVEAGTIHTFQGKEKEIIIFDITFAPAGSNKIPVTYQGDIDSDTAKLLNVAMTRAKDFFIVIGDVDGILSLKDNLVIKNWLEEILSLQD